MKKIEEYAKRLDGITKAEWSSLKIVVDEGFARKQKELDKNIKLSSVEADKVIHSIFG